MAKKLNEHGVETEFLYLGIKPMAGCIACGKCSEIGRCVFHNQVNIVLDKLTEYDGIVVGSPVYYAGPSGQLCAFLDRLFYSSGVAWRESSVLRWYPAGAVGRVPRLTGSINILLSATWRG